MYKNQVFLHALNAATKFGFDKVLEHNNTLSQKLIAKFCQQQKYNQ